MSASPLLNAAGRRHFRRSPCRAISPGARRATRGCAIRPIRPASKRSSRYADAGADIHGARMRALIVVLWRAGLRISEALA